MNEKKLLTEPERVLVELTSGERKPKNKDEEELLKDIEKIKEKGRIVDIPGEWF